MLPRCRRGSLRALGRARASNVKVGADSLSSSPVYTLYESHAVGRLQCSPRLPLRTFSIADPEMRKMTEAGFLRIPKPLLTLGVLLSLCGFAPGQDAPGTASAEWSLLAAFAFVVLGG